MGTCKEGGRRASDTTWMDNSYSGIRKSPRLVGATMNKAPVSVVIPISGKGPFREANLYATLRSLKTQDWPVEEIIVVEQSVTTDRKERPYWKEELEQNVTKYIHILDEPYCLSWIKNVGIYAATQPIIVVSDADVIFPPNYFVVLIKEFQPKLGFMQGYNLAYNLNRQGRALHLITGDWPKSPDLVSEMRPGGSSPGYLHIYDSTFVKDKLGGYNENMIEYCPCDKEITSRARNIIGAEEWNLLPIAIMHAFHLTTWLTSRVKKVKGPLNGLYLEHSYKHPLEVSELLVAADLGNPDHRTPIPYELDTE